MLGQNSPEFTPGRNKAALDSHKKADQTQKGIDQAHSHADGLVTREAQQKNPEDHEQPHQRPQSHAYLSGHFRHQGQKMPQQGGSLRLNGFRHVAGAAVVQHAQNQHGKHRPDGGQADEAEAVVLAASPAHGGHAHAQRHDEGHGHGPGGGAARVKGHAEKGGAGQGRAAEQQQVKKQQPKRHLQDDPAQGDGHEQAHAHGDHEHQQGPGKAGVHGAHLLGQHMHVRLGHGDDHADNKAGCNDEPQPF